MHSYRVAVVTVTYNSSDVLSDFLRTIRDQSLVPLVIFVDNDSSDETVHRLSPLRENERLVRNSKNLGVAAANNQGIQIAREHGCEWIVLMNNDTYADRDLIQRIITTCDIENILVASPRIIGTEPPNSVYFEGGAAYPWRGLQVKHFRMGKPIGPLDRDVFPTGYASTCCLAVHSSVFGKIGAMDESYFVYGDDVDFAVRLSNASIPIWVLASIRVYHKTSSLTGGFMSDFTVHWLTRNWVLAARKHLSYMQRLVGLSYIQLWITFRLILRRDTARQWRLRQHAFREGVSMTVSRST